MADVKAAWDVVGDRFSELSTRIGDKVRDPELRSDLESAVSALGDALATTFRELADLVNEKIAAKGDG